MDTSEQALKARASDEEKRELRDYLATKAKASAERHPPYKVRVADQFSYEDDYVLGLYETLEEAIADARAVTDKAVRERGSVEKWLGMREVGLVYDGKHTLVWSGLVENTDLRNENR